MDKVVSVSLPRSLRGLKIDMLYKPVSGHVAFRNVRPFRQRFCHLVRRSSGLSLAELCERLNDHPEILGLKSYPSFPSFYPITPRLLSDLENDISGIVEYCHGGLAFGGIGVPTDKLAAAIADVCGAGEEYERFEQWCGDYCRREDPAYLAASRSSKPLRPMRVVSRREEAGFSS